MKLGRQHCGKGNFHGMEAADTAEYDKDIEL